MNGAAAQTKAEVALTEVGARLPAVLDRLRQTALAIHRDASSLEELNERVASGAADQSDAVARTASAVEALSEKIDRISQNSEEAALACERARNEARQGLGEVHGVIEGMDRLLARIEANGRKAKRLGDRSNEIEIIVELIRGISNRTDMLALNATIESVRAGEHGRGFAVVADEIRKLAERTATATREIGTIVEAIQADTHESLIGLNEEQAAMRHESDRVRQTGKALERISQVAEHSARLVEGISRSTNDQVIATQDLVRAMQRISEVTHQTLEQTTLSRGSLKVLVQSCEPWQRVATAPQETDPPSAREHRPEREPNESSRPVIQSSPRSRPGGKRACAMTSAMPSSAPAPTSLADRFGELAELFQAVVEASDPPRRLGEIRLLVADLQAEAESQGMQPSSRALARIGLVTEVWECLLGDPASSAGEVGAFCLEAATKLAQALRSGEDGHEIAQWIREQSASQWGEYLDLLDTPAAPEPDDSPPEEELPVPDDSPAIDAQTLLRLFTGAAPEGTTRAEGSGPAQTPRASPAVPSLPSRRG